MIRYGKVDDYEISKPHSTKVYQRHFMQDRLPEYASADARVLEVGADINTEALAPLDVAEKWIADPYIAIAGSRQRGVPDLGPDYRISRCLVGVDSHPLPSDHFDLVFSISVLEHIGQEASGFALRYTDEPPEAQELPRRAFCEECFRLLKPGGITVHSIDHGVRNLTYHRNFIDAGFVPLIDEPVPSPDAMRDDPQAFRQDTLWGKPSEPMPPKRWPLNTVLLVGYRKPDDARTVHPVRPSQGDGP
jgi:SAM-dependent methyltransferase